MSLRLKIVSPEKVEFEGLVDSVLVPGTKGAFEILNNHAPIISVLGKGNIRVVTKEKELLFPIHSGVLECSSNNIQILVQ